MNHSRRRNVDRVRDLLRSEDRLTLATDWFSRRIRESSPSSLLSILAGPLWARLGGGEMTTADVVAVLDALEAAGIEFWVAGGWGVDLLVGLPLRRHGDLDLVLSDYNRDEVRACAALAALGYRRGRVVDEEMWMSPKIMLNDGRGHHLELHGLNWDLLTRELAADADKRRAELFSTGTLDDRIVPCLSVELQLLFHTGFDQRGIDRHDIERLQAITT